MKRRKPLARRGKTDWRSATERADRAWALAAKHQQGWECQVCGRPTYLETHHFKPKKTYPKLRYDLRNAVVLCSRHHRYDAPLSAHHDPAFRDWFEAKRPADFAYLADFKHNDSIKRSVPDLLEIADALEGYVAAQELAA